MLEVFFSHHRPISSTSAMHPEHRLDQHRDFTNHERFEFPGVPPCYSREVGAQMVAFARGPALPLRLPKSGVWAVGCLNTTWTPGLDDILAKNTCTRSEEDIRSTYCWDYMNPMSLNP